MRAIDGLRDPAVYQLEKFLTKIHSECYIVDMGDREGSEGGRIVGHDGRYMGFWENSKYGERMHYLAAQSDVSD